MFVPVILKMTNQTTFIYQHHHPGTHVQELMQGPAFSIGRYYFIFNRDHEKVKNLIRINCTLHYNWSSDFGCYS
jgi:hypothetical protein